MHLSFVSFVALLAANAAVASPATRSTCTNPSVRHEWRALGAAGQKAFADALKCLDRRPHNPSLKPTGLTADIPALNPNSSRYDDIVYTHMDLDIGVHFNGIVLPWHRLYLHIVEKILQSECGYTGTIPYWDWTLDSSDIKHSPIFNPDPKTGLGVFPEAKDGYNLTTGVFANTLRVYPIPHYLQRNYTLRPWEGRVEPFEIPFPQKEANETQTKTMLDTIVSSSVGNFTNFQGTYIEGLGVQGLHGSAHLSVGGDLAAVSHAPNDPLFWLLHGMLDRVWTLWQAASPANFYAIGGGTVADLADYNNFPAGKAPWVTQTTVLRYANLGGPELEGKTVGDVLDVQGGLLCYVYA